MQILQPLARLGAPLPPTWRMRRTVLPSLRPQLFPFLWRPRKNLLCCYLMLTPASYTRFFHSKVFSSCHQRFRVCTAGKWLADKALTFDDLGACAQEGVQ
ncbi:uncharacterized protein LOC144322345 isoform X5 [Canis aureus]